MATELFDMVDTDYLFTVVTADRAVDYIGKEVYVADSINDLEQQIKLGIFRILDSIRNTSFELRFNTLNNNGSTNAHALCVPADKVKQPPKEKKYRPFENTQEFELYTGLSIGGKCELRSEDIAYKNSRMTLMYVGYGLDLEDRCFVVLGGIKLYVSELIKYRFHQKRNGADEWIPLGVPEDER